MRSEERPQSPRPRCRESAADRADIGVVLVGSRITVTVERERTPRIRPRDRTDATVEPALSKTNDLVSLSPSLLSLTDTVL